MNVATGFTPGWIAGSTRSLREMPGQIAPKGIIAGSTRSLRCNADDAEVVPPDAVVVTGFTPGWIAGSTRSLRCNADDAEVV
ncbi:hypothetical protein N9P58_02315, partial [Puniceicoccaceae bacterium]|nr:hypothetical protein [Puniceicoccaceae bacterium]